MLLYRPVCGERAPFLFRGSVLGAEGASENGASDLPLVYERYACVHLARGHAYMLQHASLSLPQRARGARGVIGVVDDSILVGS